MTPAVLSELATMQRVAETGCNLARAGRCELKLALGRSGLAQAPDPVLAKRLRKILLSDAEHTLVCLPRVFDGFPDANKEHFYAEFTRPRGDGGVVPAVGHLRQHVRVSARWLGRHGR